MNVPSNSHSIKDTHYTEIDTSSPNSSTHTTQQPSTNSSQSTTATTNDGDEDGDLSGYYDADFSWFGKGDTYAKRAAKAMYPAAMATLNGMEWIGEKVVNTFGLNQSRFQYAVDEFERQERKRLAREQRDLDAQVEAYRQRGMAEGMDDAEEDISDIPYAPPIVAKPKKSGSVVAGAPMLAAGAGPQ